MWYTERFDNIFQGSTPCECILYYLTCLILFQQLLEIMVEVKIQTGRVHCVSFPMLFKNDQVRENSFFDNFYKTSW